MNKQINIIEVVPVSVDILSIAGFVLFFYLHKKGLTVSKNSVPNNKYLVK